MKTAKTIVKAEQATAVDFGTFDKLNEYVLELGPEVKIPGKVFGGTLTGATGGEFSFFCFVLSVCEAAIRLISTINCKNKPWAIILLPNDFP